MRFDIHARGTVAALVFLGLAATGCTTTVSGTPSPAPQTSPSTAQDVFAGLNACQLLDQLNAGEGFRPGRNISKRNECTSTKNEYGARGLALDPVQGLQEFLQTDPNATETTVNGRRALESPGSAGACDIAIEMGPHARVLVDITIASANEYARACPDARQFAQRVEPLLPKTPS
ncbi:DUF3558 domain-containing protein [Amycolatopsis methanolica]|uniref:DUF3558 domain-containing protein n=1 Tax=Amycolatopsis methanolica TaxID=1814 RepID=UPI0034129C96